MPLLSFFTDPVLRAPTVGCMLMAIAASLVGVFIFVRHRSLVGETLSHATYPGVIVAVIIAAALELTESDNQWIGFLLLTGAFISALLGIWLIHLMESYLRIRQDSALCFILAVFFGVGLTLASHVQFTHPMVYRQVQMYLFGQAATMTDLHLFFYGGVALFVIVLILLFYKEIQLICFDRQFAHGIKGVVLANGVCFILVVLTVVAGIRTVGIVLMSAMLIAPAITARQITHHFGYMFIISAVVGMVAGFFGNYVSVQEGFNWKGGALPTGPAIVLVLCALCLLSLLFAFERGLVFRLIRVMRFRYRCVTENMLKTLWRQEGGQPLTGEELAALQGEKLSLVAIVMMRLSWKGWVLRCGGKYSLTSLGQRRAAHIVRLHRLWEVYLVDFLGVGAERVHRSAEEMEHILTPELEKQLNVLLQNPQEDPHHQPIPPHQGFV